MKLLVKIAASVVVVVIVIAMAAILIGVAFKVWQSVL